MGHRATGLLTATSLIACVAAAAPALAQEAAPAPAPDAAPPRPTASNAGLSGDIVVTARKRGEEMLQDIPASISAIGGEELARRGVSGFEDFAYQVPGLTFTNQGPGLKRYTLRGIQSAGQEQVAVYYDEVPIPGIQSSTGDSGSQIGDLQLYDMSRVEVLKGPQSTTFGANSQTGAIRFITNKPNLSTVEGSVKVEANIVSGGNEGGDIYGMINMPIVQDTLGLRVVGYYDRTAGYVDNVRLGNKNINSDNTAGFRAILRLEPSPDWSIDAMAWYQRRDTNGASEYSPYDSFRERGDSSDPGWNDRVPRFAYFETGKFNSGSYVKSPRPDRQELYSLTANGDLGFAALTVTGSVYKRNLQFYRDNFVWSLGVGPAGEICPSGNPCVRPDLVPQLTDQTQDLNQKTFEARLNSTGSGPFQWVTGVFYRDRDSDFRSFSPLVDENGDVIVASTPPTGFSTAPGAGIEGCNPCAFARINTRRIKEKAIFGEGTFDITDSLEVMAGLRWFEAKQRDNGATLFQFPTFGSTLPAPYNRRVDENRFIPKGQISFKPTQDLTFYALAAKGYRLGGTNQSAAVAVPDGYESDSLWNYELGMKSTWFDRRLIFNAAIYQIDWDNIQVTGRDPTNSFGFIGNAGAARIQGMEVEVQARPADGLDISAGFNWLPKRELTEDQVSADIAAPGRKGDKIPRIPAFTANFSAQYSAELVEGWNGFIRGDYSFKGKSGTELRPVVPAGALNLYRTQRSFSLVNARIGANNDDNGLGVALFMDNIFDVQGDVFLAAAANVPTTKITNRPRTVGIELTKRF
ncbi:TonB-dependent receptor [Allosphingosinicella indica]|uniref:Outer membrane receptor proteins, mostly Fe transport n=1 Tax=Allosphingosinicella indica TaxID=941907 RepID=A0A1X7FZM5_9SPHN|nr:TonB-dependent receptor [Allosphingosinicella indica]SMF60922.1 Outer membrane receptor proteins, mostly Fe transport [Allosphingosinicella indica]